MHVRIFKVGERNRPPSINGPSIDNIRKGIYCVPSWRQMKRDKVRLSPGVDRNL